MLTAAYITEMEVLLQMYQFGDRIAERYFGERSILGRELSHTEFFDLLLFKYRDSRDIIDNSFEAWCETIGHLTNEESENIVQAVIALLEKNDSKED